MKPFGFYGGDDFSLNDIDYGPVRLTHAQAAKAIVLALQELDIDQDIRLPEQLFERHPKTLNPIVRATPVALIRWASQFLEEEGGAS
jgi:hypothetical protein